MQAGDDDGGVDESVLEIGIAGQELGVEEVGVGDVGEESDVDEMVRREVLEGEGFDARGHSCEMWREEGCDVEESCRRDTTGGCRELLRRVQKVERDESRRAVVEGQFQDASTLQAADSG